MNKPKNEHGNDRQAGAVQKKTGRRTRCVGGMLCMRAGWIARRVAPTFVGLALAYRPLAACQTSFAEEGLPGGSVLGFMGVWLAESAPLRMNRESQWVA